MANIKTDALANYPGVVAFAGKCSTRGAEVPTYVMGITGAGADLLFTVDDAFLIANGMNRHTGASFAFEASNDGNAKASLDMGTVTTNVDTVVEAAAGGTAGNSWQIMLVPGAGAKAGVGHEDATNKVFVWTYQAGTSDVSDFETVITAAANLAVKTGGTGATVVQAADALYSGGTLAGGTVATYVAWTAYPTPGLHIHFTAGTTTVTNVTTAVNAAHADKFCTVSRGTGATVLQAGDDDAATTFSNGNAYPSEGYSVALVDTGQLRITFDHRANTKLSVLASLQLNAGATQFCSVGPYVAASRTVDVWLWDVGGGAVADIAYNANNNIHFVAFDADR